MNSLDPLSSMPLEPFHVSPFDRPLTLLARQKVFLILDGEELIVVSSHEFR